MVMLNYASGATPLLRKQQGNAHQERGLERSSLDVESPSSTSCGSMRQLGALKRRKRTPQRSGRA